MNKKEIFQGIFLINDRIHTLNPVKRKKVYGEKLVEAGGEEFREWSPFRSKLAAAIKRGLKEMPIKKDSIVLYLGSAEGTTVSHVSDIIGDKGTVFGVDISQRAMQNFIKLAEERKNIIPILADANKPEEYEEYLKDLTVDVLYQDVSQKNQVEIFLKNAKMFLQKGKFGMLAFKARSIDVKKSAEELIKDEIKEIEKEFKILQIINIHSFEKDHLFLLLERT